MRLIASLTTLRYALRARRRGFYPRLRPPQGAASRFEKFTERARRALSVAHEEVFRFHQMEIGTEHILLGLIEDPDSIASGVMSSLGAEPSVVREQIERAVIRGPAPWPRDIGLSQGAKKVIESAVEEARSQRHRGIGTGHLLIGLMQEGEGLAARVLQYLGLSLDAVQAAVRTVVEQDRTGALEATPSPADRPQRPGSVSVHQPEHGRAGFERFSERARRVLARAAEEAQRHNHNYFGTEHILLALAADGEGVAARVLGRLGLEPATLRSDLERAMGHGPGRPSGDIGLTPGAKEAVAMAIEEARRMGHSYIGTEHLLIGIILQDRGIAAEALKSHGIALDAVRAEVRAILRQHRPDDPGP